MVGEDFEYEGEFSEVEESNTTPKALTKDEAADCLTCVGSTFRKTDSTFSHCFCTYAYIAINAVDRNLSQVDVLPYFTHVMFLDLSRNRLTNDSLVSLAEMKQIISLIVDDNRLESAAIPEFPQLQILSLKNNRITSCEINHQPNLECLELAGNNIQKIESILWRGKKLPKLKELGLRNTGLTSSAGIKFPHLVSLFLADNDITELKGLEALPNLKFLHLRNNPLKTLNGFSPQNRKLLYLNIRRCRIQNLKELKKLSVLPKLERIVLLDNPFPNKNYRFDVIAMLPNIQKIDKTVIEKDEKRKAERLAKKMHSDEEDNENESDENSIFKDED